MATEVHHVKAPAEGGHPFAPDNLLSTCKAGNVAERNRRRADWARRYEAAQDSRDDERWKVARTRIILVTGPPAAGKSTYVADNAGPDDLVIDFDAIAVALGSPDSHDHDDGTRNAANIARNGLLNALRRGEIDQPVAWLVSANPRAVVMFPHHRHHEIDPGAEEAHRRADAAGRPDRWHQWIDDWYRNRTATRSDPADIEVMRPW